jgi:hypothetical protein
MMRELRCVALAGVLMVAACGGGGDDAGGGGAARGSSAPTAASAVDSPPTNVRLLTSLDLEETKERPREPADEALYAGCEYGWDDAPSREEGPNLVDVSHRLNQDIADFATAADAAAALDELGPVVNCLVERFDADERVVSSELVDRAVPEVGDRAVAYRIHFVTKGESETDGYVDIIGVQLDSTVFALTIAKIFTPADETFVDAALTSAIEKLDSP